MIEEGSDISLYSVGTLGLPEDVMDSCHCMGRISHWPEAVAMVKELSFKDGFDHHPHDLLDNSI